MTTTTAPPETPRPRRRAGDRIFAGSATGAGILILLVLAGVAALFVLSWLLLLIAWARSREAPDRALLKRTTAVLLLLPLVNLYFFFWTPLPSEW